MFDDVRVPAENVLGVVGEGHKVAFNILNVGRVKLGTRNIGGAKEALTGAVRYAVERRQFGRAIAEFGLIKHKIAEMAVRCFVGDAMVFRTLGDVDRALKGVHADDHPAVLKTIEEFAVECSINKVWTSEALAYAVDESLQVYGGNGYSREFPAERAYRDARITRIYEGTNEINRLIVGTRLAKNPALAAEAISRAASGLDASSDGRGSGLMRERYLLMAAKRTAALAIGRAAAVSGGSLGAEQEIVAQLADMSIETYAMESAILRAEKMARRGATHAATAEDIARVYTTDAATRVEQSARTALAAMEAPDAAERFDEIHRWLQQGPINTVAARRRIADAVIAANRYPL
jgi:alkylation response protein AidB-like acyl-CoA dehydrogenase